MLPPIDAPHHLRKHEWAPYREGRIIAPFYMESLSIWRRWRVWGLGFHGFCVFWGWWCWWLFWEVLSLTQDWILLICFLYFSSDWKLLIMCPNFGSKKSIMDFSSCNFNLKYELATWFIHPLQSLCIWWRTLDRWTSGKFYVDKPYGWCHDFALSFWFF